MRDHLETRCDNFVGAMAAFTSLVEGQVPGLSLPTEQVAPLLAMLSAEAAALRSAINALPSEPAAAGRACAACVACNDR